LRTPLKVMLSILHQ